MIEKHGLRVDRALAALVDAQILPGTGIDPELFWAGAAALFVRFTPENADLLARREELQASIDAWHDARRGQPIDQRAYQAFLREIGYLVAEPAPFTIGTTGVDEEVALLAGPQLVVPVTNARFAVNAVNARWGSLYDALYGTDALPGTPRPGGYKGERGAAVIARSKRALDEAVPLDGLSWTDWRGGALPLVDPSQLIASDDRRLLFRHHGLHIEIVIDPSHPIGATDAAGIADVMLESALTTIIDFEDSVAVVDAEDKVAAYANWLGLMKGDLVSSFEKGGQIVLRRMAEDRRYGTADGTELVLSGRSIMFVRNVGHFTTTPAVVLPGGSEAPEGVLDALLTSLIALHDIKGTRRNSRTGAIYIVKPKMHGPAEATFTDRLFDAVEDVLGLERHTIKVGVMDEERRTSANLAACIHAVKDRIVFINTGFLDRTGDEIHTSMLAGSMMRKGDMKGAAWIKAYEDRNVQIGLACGFGGRGQIGKGMWAAPDRMADLLAEKIAHPLAGASTAWVPSPTAATLHALHYHTIDVAARQAERRNEPVTGLDALLEIPLAHHNWSSEDVTAELDNNAQGILGYVVRWVDQGIGCSKVPDIHEIGLMEDRATLRISSQHIANWLFHGIVSPENVDAALVRMAARVDEQNAGDPAYRPMAPDPEASLPFQAARALVFEGAVQPSGYTEPLLFAHRAQAKAR